MYLIIRFSAFPTAFKLLLAGRMGQSAPDFWAAATTGKAISACVSLTSRQSLVNGRFPLCVANLLAEEKKETDEWRRRRRRRRENVWTWKAGADWATTIEQSGNRCQTISLHSSCRYCLLVYFWCRHFFHWRDKLTEQAPDPAPRVITTAAGSERLSINATDTDWPLPGPVATDWFPSPPLLKITCHLIQWNLSLTKLTSDFFVF